MASLDKNMKAEYEKLLQLLKVKKRYHKLNPLGEGGLAVVSSSYDKFLNRIVAVKELKKDKRDNIYLFNAFLTEVKLISFLDHPGVVPIYDTFFTKDNEICYSMKLIEGIRLLSLFDYRAKGKDEHGVTLNQFLDIFRKICETLAYVHDKGVIHLDVKPENIMIGKYGEVMIMDWGNARLYDPKPYYEYFEQHLDDVKLTDFEKEERNVILGTPHYMSPEQTNHPRDLLTPQSDIFSAGIILYVMLTGKHPFSIEYETREIMKQIRDHNPKPAHEVNIDIPIRLSIICQNMLEKDLKKRYRSFKVILEDLDDFYNSGQAFANRTYQPGEIIVREGESGDYSFKIISGKVEVSKMAEGKQKVLAELGKGEIVGELAVFTKQPRTATVKAIEPTTIRIMDKESVDKELEKLSPWVGNMIADLSKRFIEMNKKIVKMG